MYDDPRFDRKPVDEARSGLCQKCDYNGASTPNDTRLVDSTCKVDGETVTDEAELGYIHRGEKIVNHETYTNHSLL